MSTTETLSSRIFAAVSSLALSAFVFAIAIAPATPALTASGMMA